MANKKKQITDEEVEQREYSENLNDTFDDNKDSITKEEVMSIITSTISQNNNALLQQIQTMLNAQNEKNIILEQKKQEESSYKTDEKESGYEKRETSAIRENFYKKTKNIEYDAERLVSIQNMTIGLASYYDGRSAIQFTQPFSIKKMRWSKLKDFIDYATNKSIFENGNLVILDEDVRIVEGLQEVYEEKCATEKDFKDFLKLDSDVLLSKLHKLKNSSMDNQLIRVNDLRIVFLNFFLKEYNKGNPDVMDARKFTKLDNYYRKEFSVDPISQIALTMRDDIKVWNM